MISINPYFFDPAIFFAIGLKKKIIIAKEATIEIAEETVAIVSNVCNWFPSNAITNDTFFF